MSLGRHEARLRQGRPISASYEIWYIIKKSYSDVNISNFSRRKPTKLGINHKSAMRSTAQSRRNNGLTLVNRGLVLALVRAFTLLLLLGGVAGESGGAGT